MPALRVRRNAPVASPASAAVGSLPLHHAFGERVVTLVGRLDGRVVEDEICEHVVHERVDGCFKAYGIAGDRADRLGFFGLLLTLELPDAALRRLGAAVELIEALLALLAVDRNALLERLAFDLEKARLLLRRTLQLAGVALVLRLGRGCERKHANEHGNNGQTVRRCDTHGFLLWVADGVELRAGAGARSQDRIRCIFLTVAIR